MVCGSAFEIGGSKWLENLRASRLLPLRDEHWEARPRRRCSAAWPAARLRKQEPKRRRASRWKRKRLRLCRAERRPQRPGRWLDPWCRSRKSRNGAIKKGTNARDCPLVPSIGVDQNTPSHAASRRRLRAGDAFSKSTIHANDGGVSQVTRLVPSCCVAKRWPSSYVQFTFILTPALDSPDHSGS